MSIKIAKVRYRAHGGLELERHLFEAVKKSSDAYFVVSTIRTNLDDAGDVRSSECVMLADPAAIRHFCNWGCDVEVLKIPHPNADVDPYVFYLPLNKLYDQNPNLTESEVSDDLLCMLEVLANAKVIQPDDYQVSVYFKRRAWFAFINLNRELTVYQAAFAHTWLRSHSWTLRGIDQSVYARYGKST